MGFEDNDIKMTPRQEEEHAKVVEETLNKAIKEIEAK